MSDHETTAAVRALRINHVSVSAPDLDRSADFYGDVLGFEELPAPTFDVPVRWFRAGDLQLHLFQRDVPAPPAHHFGLTLTVEGLQSVFARAKREGFLDRPVVRRLPDGSAQAYVRDPAGNLVELNASDAARLDPAVVGDLVPVDGPPDARLFL